VWQIKCKRGDRDIGGGRGGGERGKAGKEREKKVKDYDGEAERTEHASDAACVVL